MIRHTPWDKFPCRSSPTLIGAGGGAHTTKMAASERCHPHLSIDASLGVCTVCFRCRQNQRITVVQGSVLSQHPCYIIPGIPYVCTRYTILYNITANNSVTRHTGTARKYPHTAVGRKSTYLSVVRTYIANHQVSTKWPPDALHIHKISRPRHKNGLLRGKIKQKYFVNSFFIMASRFGRSSSPELCFHLRYCTSWASRKMDKPSEGRIS